MKLVSVKKSASHLRLVNSARADGSVQFLLTGSKHNNLIQLNNLQYFLEQIKLPDEEFNIQNFNGYFILYRQEIALV